MTEDRFVEPVCILRHTGLVTLGLNASNFTLRTDANGSTPAELVLDYQQCEGGIPIFEITSASGPGPINLAVVYSEGIEGIDHATGTYRE